MGGNFPGRNLMGGNFPGGSLPDTISNLYQQLWLKYNFLSFLKLFILIGTDYADYFFKKKCKQMKIFWQRNNESVNKAGITLSI